MTVKETTAADILNVQRLWADGDVMRFVGFPEGLHETDKSMEEWFDWVVQERPTANHYSTYEDGTYCGEAGYILDREHASASLGIKLFKAPGGEASPPRPFPTSWRRPSVRAPERCGWTRPLKTPKPSPSMSGWAFGRSRCRPM